MVVKVIELESCEKLEPTGGQLLDGNLSLLKNVQVRIEALLGDAEITVAELYELREDSIIKLNQMVDESVKLVLDGRTIALGILVAVDDHFGVQITQIEPVEP